jgi:hypothetical protein
VPPRILSAQLSWNSRELDGKLSCVMQDDKHTVGSVIAPMPSADVPQFSTAEYAHIPGTERCRVCGDPISGEYFRINSQMACSKCGAGARDGQPADSHAAWMRGLLLGAGAAIIGLMVYAAFTIITNLYLGYLALGVGWFVGKAMMKGSHGMGGRRYQVAAVALTYFAISLAEIPIWLAYEMKHPTASAAQTQRSSDAAADSSSATDADSNPPEPTAKEEPGLGKLLAQLVFIGLASPFLELRDPVHESSGW